MGNTTTMEYDTVDNVVYKYDAYDRRILSTTYDELNNPLTLTDALNYTTTKTYDTLYRLTSETDPLSRATLYGYDDKNRLISSTDALEGESTQSYDADGNMTYGPLGGAMVTFNHDARNRLTIAGDFSYIYDALNNRISITETVYGAAYSTNYVINPNAALSQTLIKTDPDGSKTYYVYGLGLIGEEKDGVYRSYHYDFRGSTVALTDSDGDVTDRYSYGPYGELLTHTGTTSTPFLYNGSDGVMTDDNGLYFMRARYYSPEIKRFFTRDEFEGRYDEILNINLYEYANNNPLSYVDPTGHIAFLIPLYIYGMTLLSSPDLYWDVQFIIDDLGRSEFRAAAIDTVGALISGVTGLSHIAATKFPVLAGRITKGTSKAGKITKGMNNIPRFKTTSHFDGNTESDLAHNRTEIP